MRWTWTLGLALGGALACAADELARPVALEAGGQRIDTEVGHAAPFLADLDGDGARDLLVGQFGEGKLKVYRNEGSDAQPRFGEPVWFLDGKPEGTVPFG